VLAAIYDLDSERLTALPAYSSPNGSNLSRSLDSVDSVRFSKFECFERLRNSDEKGFCKSSRACKSIRFRNRHIEFDSCRPSQAVSRSAGLPKGRENWPVSRAVRAFASSLVSNFAKPEGSHSRKTPAQTAEMGRQIRSSLSGRVGRRILTFFGRLRPSSGVVSATGSWRGARYGN
jgi:hypothetical protein